MQGTQRYVIFTFLAFGLLVWITLAKLFSTIAYFANIPDPAIIGSGFTVATLLGLAISAGAGWYTYRREDVNQFSNAVVEELQKVHWPDRKETQQATVVVIITTLVIAALLGVFDSVWAELTSFIYVRS